MLPRKSYKKTRRVVLARVVAGLACAFLLIPTAAEADGCTPFEIFSPLNGRLAPKGLIIIRSYCGPSDFVVDLAAPLAGKKATVHATLVSKAKRVPLKVVAFYDDEQFDSENADGLGLIALAPSRLTRTTSYMSRRTAVRMKS